MSSMNTNDTTPEAPTATLPSIYRPRLGYGATIEHVSGPELAGAICIKIAGRVCEVTAKGLGSACGGHGMGNMATVAVAAFELDGLSVWTADPFEAAEVPS